MDSSRVKLACGDAITVMRRLPDNYVDAIVTDPDYSLIVNPKIRAWGGVPGLDWATECLRVLKPGGHLLTFGGTRTAHRLACAIEDAGFEIRDSIAWLYGSGFPKSLDVSKAIDKAAGATRTEGMREWSGGQRQSGVMGVNLGTQTLVKYDSPATDAAAQWDGWGTALKPAHEPIIVARKRLGGTVVQNVLTHGTGALNIDACRIETSDNLRGGAYSGHGRSDNGVYRNGEISTGLLAPGAGCDPDSYVQPSGRFPANVVLDESQAAELDRQSGNLTSGVLAAHHARAPKEAGILGAYGSVDGGRGYGDTGGASRFFYCAKASPRERPQIEGDAHPTVKPLTLMRWLVRLVTPPDGIVLDPFIGSGTTAEACLLEGMRCIGIDIDPGCIELTRIRLSKHQKAAVQ